MIKSNYSLYFFLFYFCFFNLNSYKDKENRKNKRKISFSKNEEYFESNKDFIFFDEYKSNISNKKKKKIYRFIDYFGRLEKKINY